MNDLFVDYETALKLQELGFKEKCIAKIDNNDALHIKSTKRFPGGNVIDEIDCPLKYQVFKWFRTKFFIHSSITWIDETKSWAIAINKMKYYKNTNDKYKSYLAYSTYEEAELDCIIKIINIVKNAKNI